MITNAPLDRQIKTMSRKNDSEYGNINCEIVKNTKEMK